MRGRGKKAKTPRNIPSAQLCWKCQNAVPSIYTKRGCNWSIKFEPVEGWTATETERDRNGQQGYRITACPEFVPDEEKPKPKKPEQTDKQGVFFEWYCKKNGVTVKEYTANIDKLPADERALLTEICEKGTAQTEYAKAHYCDVGKVKRDIRKAFALLREYAQGEKEI